MQRLGHRLVAFPKSFCVLQRAAHLHGPVEELDNTTMIVLSKSVSDVKTQNQQTS